jgi:predicted P-loop ATPase
LSQDQFDYDLKRATAAILRMPDPDWKNELIVNKQRVAKPILANATTALRKASEWKDVLAFDDFAVRIAIQKQTPWGKEPGEQWTDNDDRHTAIWLQHAGIYVSTNQAGEAVQTVALESRVHPVRDYLNSLRWDGEKRIGTWVNTYLGVDPDREIARSFGRLWLISAVARILQPGSKADCCLILEGRQGIGKSTALRILAGKWFTDQLAEMGSKDAAMQCHGVWIVEWPRGCVFAGSTNKDTYSTDETGGRGVWPIECGRIDTAGLARDRDQLWAEAIEEYLAGASWWLKDAAQVEAAQAEQAQRYEIDPWAEKISEYIALRDEVSIGDLLRHLGKPEGQWTRADEMRVSAYLKSQGWSRFRDRVGTGRRWLYRRSQ